MSLLPRDIIEKNLRASIEAKQAMLADTEMSGQFSKAALCVIKPYQKGGRLYIAGNGDSAADGQHLAAEFVSRLSPDRNPLPTAAMTVDSSLLTAIGNDFGYEIFFSRQVYGKVTAHDVFLGITTLGNSKNILKVLQGSRECGVSSLLFAGDDGGHTAPLADHVVIAEGRATSTIQELHIVLAHTLCECVEQAIFPN
ncbi:SIS domain-containing protein [Alphaproteobacteria bacterium]|nr:SIS domain-containing protein [Alphaproteobacteria bacterium]